MSTGCFGAGSTRDTPLYPAGAQPLERERVARLVGYVQQVDGEDVAARGSSFALLPGCHVVVTPTQWSRGTANSGAITVDTGPITFALPMKAGHQYLVDVHADTGSGPRGGNISIQAYEKDLEGNTKDTFQPATSTLDIKQCEDRARAQPST